MIFHYVKLYNDTAIYKFSEILCAEFYNFYCTEYVLVEDVTNVILRSLIAELNCFTEFRHCILE